MVKIKKIISDSIRSLNASGSLQCELRLAAVVTNIAQLEEAAVLEIIQDLSVQAAEVADPTGFVNAAAKALLEQDDEDVEPEDIEPEEAGGPPPKVMRTAPKAGPAAPGGKAMRPGDWFCIQCGDHQYSKNMSCRKCGTAKPVVVGSVGGGGGFGGKGASKAAAPKALGGPFAGGGMVPASKGKGKKPGDWHCHGCGDLNFQGRESCRLCNAPKPVGAASVPAAGKKAGDWVCPCGELVFAGRPCCRLCNTPAPDFGMQGAAAGDGWMAPAAAAAGGKAPVAVAGKKPGDWNCPACGDLNYAGRTACRLCNAPQQSFTQGSEHPGKGMKVGGKGGGKAGDWNCPQCGDLVFKSRDACRQCGTPKPEGIEDAGMMHGMKGGGKGGGKAGDWNCPQCGDLVFKSRDACRQCGTPKPEGIEDAGMTHGMKRPLGKPGDWNCPQCGDLVFKSRDACRQCGSPKPEGIEDAGNADGPEWKRICVESSCF